MDSPARQSGAPRGNCSRPPDLQGPSATPSFVARSSAASPSLALNRLTTRTWTRLHRRKLDTTPARDRHVCLSPRQRPRPSSASRFLAMLPYSDLSTASKESPPCKSSLWTKVANLGNLGDVVTVKAGYARTYSDPDQAAPVRNGDQGIRSRGAELEKLAADKLTAAQARREVSGMTR